MERNEAVIKKAPDLWHVQEKLPLPRERARMSEAEQRERIGMVARTARAREEVLERARIEAEMSLKNMSNVDEIVFGRDMDGSGDVGIGGAEQHAEAGELHVSWRRLSMIGACGFTRMCAPF